MALHALCFLGELDSIATPILHDLISLKIERLDEDQRDWRQVPCLPRLLDNLKCLEITNLMGTNLEIKMLQHILSNAPVLEHLYISVTLYYENCDSHKNKDQLRKEYEFCMKLFMFPKSSQSCKIKFSGIAITTSNKDFCDGVLTCQISRYDRPLHDTDSD